MYTLRSVSLRFGETLGPTHVLVDYSRSTIGLTRKRCCKAALPYRSCRSGNIWNFQLDKVYKRRASRPTSVMKTKTLLRVCIVDIGDDQHSVQALMARDKLAWMSRAPSRVYLL